MKAASGLDLAKNGIKQPKPSQAQPGIYGEMALEIGKFSSRAGFSLAVGTFSAQSHWFLNGWVPEWSNGLAWKACVPQKGTEGSNPSPSASFLSLFKEDSFFL